MFGPNSAEFVMAVRMRLVVALPVLDGPLWDIEPPPEGLLLDMVPEELLPDMGRVEDRRVDLVTAVAGATKSRWW